MDQRKERRQLFNLAERPTEDRVAAAEPACAARHTEIERPAGALAAVERGGQVVGSFLQFGNRQLEAFFRPTSAVTDKAHGKCGGEQNSVAEQVGLAEAPRLMAGQQDSLADAEHHGKS